MDKDLIDIFKGICDDPGGKGYKKLMAKQDSHNLLLIYQEARIVSPIIFPLNWNAINLLV